MREWAHAPVHRLHEQGTFMVTAGTLHKKHYLSTPERVELVHDTLLMLADEFEWQLQAWSVLANHYHFVALSPEDPKTLVKMLTELHSRTATELNRMDNTPGRRVWYQYWESKITYQKSYLARLKYVHANAVRHGLVKEATQYRCCSAWWFQSNASNAFQRTVESFGIDRLNVLDDFGEFEALEKS
jgi:putative transposase